MRNLLFFAVTMFFSIPQVLAAWPFRFPLLSPQRVENVLGCCCSSRACTEESDSLCSKQDLAIQDLPLVREVSCEVQPCPVCFEEISSSASVVLPCRHIFCGYCVGRLLDKGLATTGVCSLRCPLCRAEFAPTPPRSDLIEYNSFYRDEDEVAFLRRRLRRQSIRRRLQDIESDSETNEVIEQFLEPERYLVKALRGCKHACSAVWDHCVPHRKELLRGTMVACFLIYTLEYSFQKRSY